MPRKFAWTFESAVAFWRGHVAEEMPDALWSRFTAAEAFILDHRPQSTAEAADMVSVLIEDRGPRSDGRDVAALRTLRVFLQVSATGLTRPLFRRRSRDVEIRAPGS